MYVYTPVRNNAGRATTLALAHYPFSGQPPPPRPIACALPRGCHHPYHAIPILTATYTLPPTTHIAHLFPLSLPSSPPPPPQPPTVLHLTPVSAASPLLPSTTHTTTHSFHPPTYTVSFSRRACAFLFPFLFPLPSFSNARSNPPGGYDRTVA